MSYQDTIKELFQAQLDCKVLANLRKLEVLKCIIMHSLWQLAETRSRSLSSVSIIHVLQVHSWSRQEDWSAILDATEFQKLQKYCRKYCTLLLLYFLFDHSEIFTGETRYIVPCYNKARNSNFCLEFQKLQKYCRNYRFLQNATPPSVLIQSF